MLWFHQPFTLLGPVITIVADTSLRCCVAAPEKRAHQLDEEAQGRFFANKLPLKKPNRVLPSVTLVGSYVSALGYNLVVQSNFTRLRTSGADAK